MIKCHNIKNINFFRKLFETLVKCFFVNTHTYISNLCIVSSFVIMKTICYQILKEVKINKIRQVKELYLYFYLFRHLDKNIKIC